MSNKLTIEEAEQRDVEIGHISITGYDCVKSNFSQLTRETQRTVLEQIVRGEDDTKIVQTVHDAASSISAKDTDWDRIGIPQGLGQHISREKAGQDDYYSWSDTGDHPQGEAPRAAYFANKLLDVEFGEGDKPKRAAIANGPSVNGTEIDVIAYNEAADLLDVDVQVDVQEMQRKCIERPLRDILDAFGIEPEPAMRGQCQSQSGLSAFM